MTKFNPTALKSVSAVADLAQTASNKRSAQDVVLAGIEKQLALFADPEADGKRWFRSGATDTAFSIRYSNQKLKLRGDEDQLAVPTAQFGDAMAYYVEEVKAGKFDAQLAVIEKGIAARSDKMRETRAAKNK